MPRVCPGGAGGGAYGDPPHPAGGGPPHQTGGGPLHQGGRGPVHLAGGGGGWRIDCLCRHCCPPRRRRFWGGGTVEEGSFGNFFGELFWRTFLILFRRLPLQRFRLFCYVFVSFGCRPPRGRYISLFLRRAQDRNAVRFPPILAPALIFTAFCRWSHDLKWRNGPSDGLLYSPKQKSSSECSWAVTYEILMWFFHI